MSHAADAFRVVIPARLGSSRFPGKPLALIEGRPMIEHVWRRACASAAEEVIVATDADEIVSACQSFGAEVVMTGAELRSGTDRVAEVARMRQWADRDIVVNAHRRGGDRGGAALDPLRGQHPLSPGAASRNRPRLGRAPGRGCG